jgi:hypothetical protein
LSDAAKVWLVNTIQLSAHLAIEEIDPILGHQSVCAG